MNVEIRRVANGYVVLPPVDWNRGSGISWNELYFFSTYQQLTDKLQEILDTPQPEGRK